MGMFDTVALTCPGCKKKVEIQSKAGDCAMLEFVAEAVPPMVALDIQGEHECRSCGKTFIVECSAIQRSVRVDVRPKE